MNAGIKKRENRPGEIKENKIRIKAPIKANRKKNGKTVKQQNKLMIR